MSYPIGYHGQVQNVWNPYYASSTFAVSFERRFRKVSRGIDSHAIWGILDRERQRTGKYNQIVAAGSSVMIIKVALSTGRNDLLALLVVEIRHSLRDAIWRYTPCRHPDGVSKWWSCHLNCQISEKKLKDERER